VQNVVASGSDVANIPLGQLRTLRQRISGYRITARVVFGELARAPDRVISDEDEA